MAHKPHSPGAAASPTCGRQRQSKAPGDLTAEQESHGGLEDWREAPVGETEAPRWPEEGASRGAAEGQGGRPGPHMARLQGCSSARAQLCVHMGCGGGTWFMQGNSRFLNLALKRLWPQRLWSRPG